MVMDRPSRAVVHRSRSGHPAHTEPKVTVRAGLIGRVCLAGQVTMPAPSTMVKSRPAERGPADHPHLARERPCDGR
jgi:hypothetical protein